MIDDGAETGRGETLNLSLGFGMNTGEGTDVPLDAALRESEP